MPTIRVVGDNVIEFVDSNGDVAAREEYDEAASEVSFVDGDGNPMPVSLGDATADSVSTQQAALEVLEEVDDSTTDRILRSKEAADIYVDPDGNDSGAGTQSDPIASLSEVYRRLPLIIDHGYNIHFADGTYNVETPGASGLIFVRQGTNHDLTFIGDANTPSNVVFDGRGINLQIRASSPHTTKFEGIQFDTKLEGYNSNFTLENCNLNSTTDRTIQSAVGGYDNFIRIRNCTFGGDADYALSPEHNSVISISGCDGSVNTAFMYPGYPAWVYNDGNTISYPALIDGPIPEMLHYVEEGGTHNLAGVKAEMPELVGKPVDTGYSDSDIGEWKENTDPHPVEISVTLETNSSDILVGLQVSPDQTATPRDEYYNENTANRHKTTLSYKVRPGWFYRVTDFSSSAAIVESWEKIPLGPSVR